MKIIAIKSRVAGNSNLGYVKPILKFDEVSQGYVKAEESMFPNDGEIFIYGGYNYINTSIPENELFELQDVSENEKGFDAQNLKSCYYATNSNLMRRLSEVELLKIFNCEFDLLNRRIGQIPQSNHVPFFICDTNFLYGPMTYEINNQTWAPININYLQDLPEEEIDDVVLDLVEQNADCIFKFDLKEVASLYVEDYVLNLNDILKTKPFSIIYAGSKEKTIAWGKAYLLKTELLSSEESRILDKIKGVQIPNLSKDSDKQKFDSLKNYLHEINEWVNIKLPNYLQSFLNSDKGQNYTEKYLNENKDTFFRNYRSEEIQAVDLELSSKKQELETLQQKQDDMFRELETKEDKIFEGVPDEEKVILKKLINNAETRRNFLDYDRLVQINVEVNRKEGEKNYLDREIKKREEEKVKLENQQKSVTEAIQKVKNDFFDETHFAQKLIDAKIYTDILNNIDPTSSNSSKSKSEFVISPPMICSKQFDAVGFITELVERLKENNRTLDFNQVANYVVTIHQNFLVVLAGLPGIGKTSLVEKISKALGCYDNDRYLSIPVQKGWTSAKDLIGFYNPITQKYQPSKTQLLKYLKKTENDFESKIEYPSIILLDEANLSPIEHYWSDFSSVYDHDFKKEIKISEKEIIRIGNGLRFLATINYDHTTEVLSDRFISRVPIIKLSKADYVYEEEMYDDKVFDTFKMTDIASWLKPNKEYFRGDIKSRFESIVNIMEDEENPEFNQPISISYRKYKSIERYCNVAGNIMKDSNQFLALDYSVNQYILPLINGRGNKFRNRLVSLQGKLQGLPMSSKQLDKIVQFGDQNLNYYKFFF